MATIDPKTWAKKAWENAVAQCQGHGGIYELFEASLLKTLDLMLKDAPSPEAYNQLVEDSGFSLDQILSPSETTNWLCEICGKNLTDSELAICMSFCGSPLCGEHLAI